MHDNWDLQGVGYLGLGEHYNAWMYRLRRKVFLRNVKPLDDHWENKDVLDIGSGTGFYIKLWKELKVKSITATDISKFAVTNLKESFLDVECIQLDIGECPPELVERKKYDVISAFDVLFHIIDDGKYRSAIKNIFNMLRPSGLFIFSENFVHGNAIRRDHQVSRTQDEIETILRDCGFEISVHAPMFVLMNYPIDSDKDFYKSSWEKMAYLVEKYPYLGLFAGSLLFPIELILTSDMKRGPSTELMVCTKTE